MLALVAGAVVGALLASSTPTRATLADLRPDAEKTVASSMAADDVEATTESIPAVTAPAEAVELDDADQVSDLEIVADGPSLTDEDLGDPTSYLVLVNKTRPLDPIDYAPEDLVHVDGVPGGSAELMRSEAAEALAAMRDGAVEAGLDFSITSGYRSYSEQISLHATYSGRRGATVAENFSARGGYSEHQTGWAADIYGSESCRVKRCFAQELVGAWVAENAWQYGWIVRYPEGEFETTGYWFEPWHVRYVGVELSTWMHDQGIATFEEAAGLPAAPDYVD